MKSEKKLIKEIREREKTLTGLMGNFNEAIDKLPLEELSSIKWSFDSIIKWMEKVIIPPKTKCPHCKKDIEAESGYTH